MKTSVGGVQEFHLHAARQQPRGFRATGSVLARQFALAEALGGGRRGAKTDTEPVGNDTGCDAP